MWVPAHEGWVSTFAFNPQDGTLASGGFDRAIRIWDVDTGQCLRTLTGHTKAITDLLYTPSAKQLISCSRDRTIALWDLDTGSFKTFEGHQGWVWSIGLFTANTKHLPPQTLISGSQDETVKLWNLEGGECIATWRAPRPYEGMNIDRVTGLTDAQKATLKMLGAIEG